MTSRSGASSSRSSHSACSDLRRRGQQQLVDHPDPHDQLPHAEQDEHDGERGEHVAPAARPRAAPTTRLRQARAPPAGVALRSEPAARVAARVRRVRLLRARSRRHPQRGQRAFAQLDHLEARSARAGARAGRRSPPAPGRGAARAARRGRRAATASSTSWVTSSTVRGSRASASPSHACACARVSASSAANGSSRHSSGRPASSVRRNATRWRIPPDRAAGFERSKPSSPNAAKCSWAAARAARAGVARDAPRERGVVERAQPRQQRVALGHQRRRAARSPTRHRAPRARTRVRAASTSRTRTGRRPRPPRPRARRDPRRRARRRRRTPCARRRQRRRSRKEAPLLEPRLESALRSLRGHYPDQVRRVSAGTGRYLSRAFLPAPLLSHSPNSLPLRRCAGRFHFSSAS